MNWRVLSSKRRRRTERARPAPAAGGVLTRYLGAQEPRRRRRSPHEAAMIANDGTPELVFYGVFSREAGRVIEFFGTPESAERMRARVLRDEPDWEDDLAIARVDFGSVGVVEVLASSNVGDEPPN